MGFCLGLGVGFRVEGLGLMCRIEGLGVRVSPNHTPFSSLERCLRA